MPQARSPCRPGDNPGVKVQTSLYDATFGAQVAAIFRQLPKAAVMISTEACTNTFRNGSP